MGTAGDTRQGTHPKAATSSRAFGDPPLHLQPRIGGSRTWLEGAEPFPCPATGLLTWV